jgi:hypothetical protein
MYISDKARKVVYLMMQHIRNSSQSAIFSSLEDTIFYRKPRSFYRCFVEALSLQTLGFLFKPLKGKVLEL